ALGVAAATAVLCGALIVGDSVRGSLRHLTLDRLGHIDALLVVDRFFRQELVTDLSAQLDGYGPPVSPAILFPAANVQTSGDNEKRLASGVFVLGIEASFWELERTAQPTRKIPGENEIVINAPLAEELGVKLGDSLVVRFGKADQIPADSPLGRRTDRTASL